MNYCCVKHRDTYHKMDTEFHCTGFVTSEEAIQFYKTAYKQHPPKFSTIVTVPFFLPRMFHTFYIHMYLSYQLISVKRT